MNLWPFKKKAEKAAEAVEVPKVINPLDLKEETVNSADEDIIKNIVAAETSAPENILEEMPTVDASLLQDVAPPKSVLLKVLKIVFVVLLALGLSSVAFFSFELGSAFNFVNELTGLNNLSGEITSVNKEVTNLQTDLNFYRYLSAKISLDKFSYYGDKFSQNYEILMSKTGSEKEKLQAQGEMQKLKEFLKGSFLAARGMTVNDLTAPLIDLSAPDEEAVKSIFQEKLKERFLSEAEKLKENKDPEAQRNYKNYLHAAALVGNDALYSILISSDFDSLNDEGIYNLIKNVNSSIINDLSIIQKIKEKRIRWSDIMSEIEKETMAVDIHFTQDYFDEIGGIRYTSYEFDSEGPSISISGETKRFDTTNFTMISNLIDQLNKSPLFENAEMRSFTKSGSLEEGYTATLRLNLVLTDQAKQKLEGVDNVPEFVNQPEQITR